MTKFLKQKTTGAVYAWTKDLAKRNDMVDYEPAPKATKPVEAPKAAEPVAEPVVATEAEPVDEIKEMAKAVLTKKK
jgi:hypothetical protein